MSTTMRQPATASTATPDGQLWVGNGHVVDTNINIGSLSTKGYDVNVTYTGLEMGRFGSLNFNLTGTLLDELITEPGPGIDSVRLRRVLLVGLQHAAPKPEWRHRFRTSWQTPWDLDLSLTWRYLRPTGGLRVRPRPVHRLRAAGRRLLRPRRQLGDHGEGRGHARHQQRAGRQPVAQRDGRHDRQRQHLPADVRRPRSLRVPARDGGLLSRIENDWTAILAAAFGPPLFFARGGRAT